MGVITIRKILVKILMIAIGCIIAGLGFNLFLIPSGIAPGGVSGLAMLLSELIDGVIPVGIFTIILNLPLFIIGNKILGKIFTVNSIIGTVAFSLAIDLLFFIQKYRNEILNMTSFGGETDYFLCALFGGLLLGCGLGLIFRSGATTGGTDIAARLIQQKASALTLGQLVLVMDLCFLIVILISYRSLVAALYTAVTVFVSSKVIDIVEEGVNYAKEVLIFTDKPEEISVKIMSELERGVTLIPATGMYTGNEVNILVCVVHNRQVPALRSIIKAQDDKAFVVIKDVRMVHGRW